MKLGNLPLNDFIQSVPSQLDLNSAGSERESEMVETAVAGHG